MTPEFLSLSDWVNYSVVETNGKVKEPFILKGTGWIKNKKILRPWSV